MQFQSFETWVQLIDHIHAAYPLWYQAPMDYRPVQIGATVRKDGRVRVTPTYSDADPFTADIGHLDRFRRSAK